ncbi:hypothetical protein PIB30_002451 [Stylosanthes scabra]|uniref:F-box domain-containing protein n=1 Tax=Stylosanthes scabra TaxID=79078 RepID=A0ABU6W1U3_9FABA|nr:hypothetical protein [Stylosanthes scabra]
MEEEENNNKNAANIKSINDLPLELIRAILLRISLKDLSRLSCVSKLWLSLISDPIFHTFHLQLYPRRRLFFTNRGFAASVDLHALFHNNNGGGGGDDITDLTYSLPLTHPPLCYSVMTSYNGFIVLHHHDSFIVWNPLTGSHKIIPCSHIMTEQITIHLLSDSFLFAFGYDPSHDDYMLVFNNLKTQDCIHFFSMRLNSWKIFDVEVPLALRALRRRGHWINRGIFLNGAIHWLVTYQSQSKSILVFDINKVSFNYMSLPQPVLPSEARYLLPVGGCLALTCHFDGGKTKTWVMKEYKVQSSWTLYEIPRLYFEPLFLSDNGGDIIGIDGRGGLAKYNHKGERLQHYYYEQCKYLHRDCFRSALYTESLMPVPNEEKEKWHALRIWRILGFASLGSHTLQEVLGWGRASCNKNPFLFAAVLMKQLFLGVSFWRFGMDLFLLVIANWGFRRVICETDCLDAFLLLNHGHISPASNHLDLLQSFVTSCIVIGLCKFLLFSV